MGKPAVVRNQGWGRRLRAARAEYEARHDVRLTWHDIAHMASAAAGYEIKYQAIQQYFKGREPKHFRTVIALAQTFEESPGFLAFGEPQPDTGPPDPGEPVIGTEADYVSNVTERPKRSRRSG
jgi:hypothetical protein